MKRLIFTVMILLTAGAVFNIAIAWRIAATADVELVHPGEPRQVSVWPRQVPADWPDPALVVSGRGPGLLWMGGLSATSWRTADAPLYDITVLSAGWPAPAMSWEQWRDFGKLSGHAGDVLVGPDSIWARGLHSEEPWRAVPLRPAWAGFAFNSVLYAAVGGLMLSGGRSVLRCLRR